MSKHIFQIPLILGLALAGTKVYAQTHFCIGVNNQSDKTVLFSQFPDDIGDFPVAPKKQSIFGDEISHAPYYHVRLSDPDTYKTLAYVDVKPGSMIVYKGENHQPSLTVIYPGCYRN